MSQKFYTKLRVDVTCEACGHEYHYGKFLSDGSEAGLRRKIERKNFGGKRCPECKYIQSWMSGIWAMPLGLFGFLFGVAMTGVLFGVFGEKLMNQSGWLHLVLGLVFPITMPIAFVAAAVVVEQTNNSRCLRGREVPEPREPVARQSKMNWFEELIGSLS